MYVRAGSPKYVCRKCCNKIPIVDLEDIFHQEMKAFFAEPQRIAEHFSKHPGVTEVLYPGLPGDPGHAVARLQMKGGFGGMLSIRFKGGEAAAVAVAAQTAIWKRATSLGGTESLVEHRASIEGAGTPAPPDLLRLSVGLEHVEDLIADLEQAIARAPR